QGHLPVRPHRRPAHRGHGRGGADVGLGLSARRRRVAGVVEVHRRAVRSPAEGRRAEDHLRQRAGVLPAVVIPVVDLERGDAVSTLRTALETVGFFVLVNHGVARELIAQTFAEAKRFHALPADAKLTLRMNEHNNGYMAMGRYAVWTSEVNANDKGDLNEAFFVRRERKPDDPLVIANRRFAGPNL